ncbi:uncharacterized protein CIMG_06124 [Coccidioides immitis RS]|uniref:Uncharacterized protein n=1 Tax=Coccidioides immitis (strain RS) TaxID=246410 RepID=J3K7H1_COCIM|nr:uncharacterized protein CIMG_06124 [Coccidioides immitis RS]EAS30645.3 hypothetical protein CIMG_06124 [Coccidioides immitis RS]QVM11960.1 hypothetical protein D8B26_006598 [Coccidioides posadasii str. Silveira]
MQPGLQPTMSPSVSISYSLPPTPLMGSHSPTANGSRSGRMEHCYITLKSNFGTKKSKLSFHIECCKIRKVVTVVEEHPDLAVSASLHAAAAPAFFLLHFIPYIIQSHGNTDNAVLSMILETVKIDLWPALQQSVCKTSEPKLAPLSVEI